MKKFQIINKSSSDNFTYILHEDILTTICTYSQAKSNISLKVKSKILQILYDKLCSLTMIKANPETLIELKVILENSLIDGFENLAKSKSAVAFIQSILLVLSILVKKKSSRT